EQQLKILTGLDLAAPLAIGPASLSTIDMKLLALPVADLETLALDRRAEAVGARDELRLARERVVAAGGQGLTGIDISLQYAWVRESDSFSDSLELDDHRFGVGFNMDTDFGFGDQQRRKRLLVLQYQTKKRDHERLVGDIRLQVRQAYFDVQRLQGQMDIAARALAIAEQEFSRARIRHDNGLVDPIALLEAEYQLEDARYQAYSARVGYLMAGQGLVMASGYFDIHSGLHGHLRITAAPANNPPRQGRRPAGPRPGGLGHRPPRQLVRRGRGRGRSPRRGLRAHCPGGVRPLRHPPRRGGGARCRPLGDHRLRPAQQPRQAP